MKRLGIFSLLFLFLISGGSWAADALKPFQLVSSAPGDMAAIIAGTKDKLATGGFQVVGEYSPYEGAHVVVATNDELLKIAGQSEHGGYGAVGRVSVTRIDGEASGRRRQTPFHQMLGDAHPFAFDPSARIAQSMCMWLGSGM